MSLGKSGIYGLIQRTWEELVVIKMLGRFVRQPLPYMFVYILKKTSKVVHLILFSRLPMDHVLNITAPREGP